MDITCLLELTLFTVPIITCSCYISYTGPEAVQIKRTVTKP
jgi:hypothetical protein